MKTPTEKILVVEDDETLRMVFKKALESKGCSVDLAEDGKEALDLASRRRYLMVFMDIVMPESCGLDILEQLKAEDAGLIVVMMTAQNTMRNAIEAMSKGAYDYLAKPVDLEEIFLIVDKAKNEKKLRKKMSAYERELKDRFEVGEIIGKSRKMREVFKLIGKAAPSDVTVLIRGENGTGKELVGKALHYHSARVVFPFIAINCAAIPRELLENELFGHEKGAFTGATETRMGKFEMAGKGTIFLDEIGDMDIDVQAKILRVLQEREYHRVGGTEPLKANARIIAATNKDLKEEIRQNRFREDLYHRINVITVDLPSLRERKEDIPLLAEHFVKMFSAELGVGPKRISRDALNLLINYDFPGNVRQLENLIKRGLVLSTHDIIFPEHLPRDLSDIPSGDDRVSNEGYDFHFNRHLEALLSNGKNTGSLYNTIIRQTEKKLISALLEKCGWNQIQTASRLGINRNTLKRKMDELDIKKL